MVLSERYRVIKKGGKKLIKYREVMKWKILNNLQYMYSPPMGKMKRLRRIRAFVRDFENKNKEIKRITETIVRGA
jgi:hypothetical protein